MPKPSAKTTNPDNRQIPALAGAGAHVGVGVQFAVTITLCVSAGWWMDERWSTTPLFLISGMVFGAVGGFYHLYKTLTAAPPEPPGQDVKTE